MSPFHTINHIADIAVVIQAKSREGLLSEGCRAVFFVLTGKVPAGRHPGETVMWKRVKIGYKTFDTLFIDFLNWLVTTADVKGVLPVSVVPRIGKRRAAVTVGFIKAKNGDIIREIKAATHHRYRVNESEGGLRTTVTFDV